jgi:hypothetical protein
MSSALQMHLSRGEEDPKVETPPISVVLATIAMIPIASGAAVAWMFRSPVAERLTLRWCGSILCFLAGVKRGLAFRQSGGPTAAQIGATFWTFLPGAIALLVPWRIPSILALLFGFGSEAVLGPVAAEREEAPRFFARLRPVQMAVPVASLLFLLLTEGDRSERN